MNFEEMLGILRNQFNYINIYPSQKDIHKLTKQFGETVVQKALQDQTSILAHPFIQNKKPTIWLEYSYSNKDNQKAQKKIISSLKTQFKKTFPTIKRSKVIEDRINEFIIEKGINRSVKIIKINNEKEINTKHELYFFRVLEIADLNFEASENEINKYDLALKIAEKWPFLSSYIHGNSLIENKSALINELELRNSYLKEIKKMNGPHIKTLELLIYSFPNPISSHTDLEKSIEKVSSPFDCIKHLNLSGILIKKEIKEMKSIFKASKKALKNTQFGCEMIYDLPQKNAFIHTFGGDVSFKIFNNFKNCQYEIAGYEMAKIGGFSCILTPMKRCNFTPLLPPPHYNEYNPRLAISKLDNIAIYGGRILYSIEESFKDDFFSMNFDALISPLIKVDPFYFEMAVLHNLLLGTRVADFKKFNFGNKIIFPFNIEYIMPEDNESSSLFLPFITKLKFDWYTDKEPKPVETRNYEVKDVCSINCALIGLPQANLPFSKRTIKHILQNMHEEDFLRYHQRKRIFNERQVTAQLERISLIRKLMEKEDNKEIITLTPKNLFLEIVKNHNTYQILKNFFQLSDFFIFTHLGKIPKDINSLEVKNFSEKLKKTNFNKKLKVLKSRIQGFNRIEGPEFSSFSSKILNHKNFASSSLLIEIEKSKMLQDKMMENNVFHYLLTGIKMSPVQLGSEQLKTILDEIKDISSKIGFDHFSQRKF